jgi:thioredoxin reductase (NADPH)
MLTRADVQTVPLFAALAAADIDRLARSSADLHVAAGDHVLHPGAEERALFAVLAGTLAVYTVVDGVERSLYELGPGDVFGVVPITIGTKFYAGYRAKEPVRVMRVGIRAYHAIAASSPEVSLQVEALARERIGSMRGISAEPPKPRVVVVGHRLDHACSTLLHFLSRNQILHDWMTPDAPTAATHLPGGRPTDEDLPVLVFADGTRLRRPSIRAVAERLGLQTSPRVEAYDAVIVGAGPAGLAAGVYGASEGLRTLVVEREAPGGQAGTSSRIENYLGFPAGVSGDELAARALQQASRLGAEILVTRSVTRLEPSAGRVHLDGGDVIRSRTVILATGVAWRHLAIEGFDRLMGRGVHYGAARSEASGTHGLDVHLIGAGNSAGQAALFFAHHARTVTLVVRGDSLERSMSRYLIDQLAGRPNVQVWLRSEVVAAHGSDHLTAIDVRDERAGTVRRHDCGGLFIFIGADAETAWLPPEITLDQRGYVLTGPDVPAVGRWQLDRDPYLLETSVPGIFACGDVRFSPVKRVAAAVGEGSMAIAFVHQYLRDADARPEPA